MRWMLGKRSRQPASPTPAEGALEAPTGEAAGRPAAWEDVKSASRAGMPAAGLGSDWRYRLRYLAVLLPPVLVVAGFFAFQRLANGVLLSASAAPTDCLACHREANPEASLWLSVNGKELQGAQPVEVLAGDTLEVDFHYINMLGDAAKRTAVGAAITVPADPRWQVTAGSEQHPREWNVGGKGRTYWSPAWDRGANGDGPPYRAWISSPDVPGLFFLALQNTPFPISELARHGGALPDRGKGDASDPDGVPNHAGADALVAVPVGTRGGSYEVKVYGIGHDSSGRQAYVSRSIPIRVTGTAASAPGPTPSPEPGPSSVQPRSGSSFVPAPGGSQPAAAPPGSGPPASGAPGAGPAKLAAATTGAAAPPPPTPAQLSGAEIYRRNCAGCHGATPTRNLVSGGEAQAKKAIAEGSGAMKPLAATAGGRLTAPDIDAVVRYLVADNKNIKSPAPTVKHTLKGRPDCLLCHAQGGLKPYPSDHDYRDSSPCLNCHQGPPTVPHPLEGRDQCTGCHAVPPVDASLGPR